MNEYLLDLFEAEFAPKEPEMSPADKMLADKRKELADRLNRQKEEILDEVLTPEQKESREAFFEKHATIRPSKEFEDGDYTNLPQGLKEAQERNCVRNHGLGMYTGNLVWTDETKTQVKFQEDPAGAFKVENPNEHNAAVKSLLNRKFEGGEYVGTEEKVLYVAGIDVARPNDDVTVVKKHSDGVVEILLPKTEEFESEIVIDFEPEGPEDDGQADLFSFGQELDSPETQNQVGTEIIQTFETGVTVISPYIHHKTYKEGLTEVPFPHLIEEMKNLQEKTANYLESASESKWDHLKREHSTGAIPTGNPHQIKIVVLGEPTAQKRHKGRNMGKFVQQYDPSAADKADFLALIHKHAPAVPFDCPLRMDVFFYFMRPASHYGTGNNAGILKKSAPIWKTSKPDRDNLDKFVMDSMSKIYFRDDSVVCAGEIIKKYDANPRTEIIITLL